MTEYTAELAREWRRLYEDEGLTIEQISLEAGTTPGTVRKYLRRVNTTMRPKGPRAGHSSVGAANATDGIKGKALPRGVPSVLVERGPAQVHRRRGRR